MRNDPSTTSDHKTDDDGVEDASSLLIYFTIKKHEDWLRQLQSIF